MFYTTALIILLVETEHHHHIWNFSFSGYYYASGTWDNL